MSSDLQEVGAAWAWAPFEASPARPWSRRLAAHLHRRAGFSAGTAELDEVVKAGPAAAVERLCAGPKPSAEGAEFEKTVAALAARGIGFKSLTEQIDTTTPGGKLVFHVFGALAEFERDLTRERTHAGLAAARARGRTGGRPKKLADPKQLALARRLYQDGQTDVTTICRTLGISRATLYRALKA